MFKRYPFAKQEGLKDCAVACVFMIVKYYSGYVSFNKLRDMLKVTRNGTTAYHIVQTLKDLGFNAYGVKEKMLVPTRVPFVTNIIVQNSYRHFIVVYRVTEEYLIVADPADKVKKLSICEFYKVWTGVNIMMYPVRPITKIHSNIKLSLFFPKTKVMFVIAILSVLMTVCGIVTSFFFQGVIENIDDSDGFRLVCILFLIFSFVKVLSNFFRNKVLINFTNDLCGRIVKNTFKRIVELPYVYYHNHTVGEVTSKINDLTVVSNTVNRVLLALFVDLPLMVFSGLLLFLINRVLFLITIGIVVFYLIVLVFSHKKINASIENVLKKRAEVNSFMVESIGGFETVKGLGLEGKFCDDLVFKYNQYQSLNVGLNNLQNYQAFFKNLIFVFGNLFIVICGVDFIKNGSMSFGLFITYSVLISLFLDPIRNIIDLDFEIKESVNTVKRVFGLYETFQNKINVPISSVEVKNLSFSFDDVNYVLKDINLKFMAGEKILVTGNSGNGKSTFMKLIKGYFPIYEGDVFVNGSATSGVNDSIVYVSQKEKLFTGTVYDNLVLKGSDDLEVIKRICFVDEIVCNRDLGYNFLIEENGFNISDGQRQRIALARSLHDFSMLIIDEGFSGLDVNLERRIIKNLFRVYEDKLIVVVSHRLDNLDLFDRFIKFDNGTIVLDQRKER